MTTESRGPILVGGAEKVEQSLRLILFTTPGERVLRPEFGCGLRDLVFRPTTTTFRAQVADNVRTAIQRWGPRVDLIDVLVETAAIAPTLVDLHIRSAERRVGKECVSQCRSRWSPFHQNKKT